MKLGKNRRFENPLELKKNRAKKSKRAFSRLFFYAGRCGDSVQAGGNLCNNLILNALRLSGDTQDGQSMLCISIYI